MCFNTTVMPTYSNTTVMPNEESNPVHELDFLNKTFN